MTSEPKKILFVCLGNICRSPIAEAVFLDAIKRAEVEDDWIVDSAAISDWHVGRLPDERAWNIMKKYNLEYNYNNRARQIEGDDFRNFDYIFGMDDYNISDLNELAPNDKKAKIFMLGEFDPEGPRQIKDPYCDVDMKGYEYSYAQALKCCESFLKKIYSNDTLFKR